MAFTSNIIKNTIILICEKLSLHDRIALTPLTYVSEALTMKDGKNYGERGVEMIYFRGAYGVTWRYRLMNEVVRDHCGVTV